MASPDPTAALDRLHESIVDGRTENGRYRQGQLHSLHKALREQAVHLCAALQADSRSTAAEVEAEYYLTMQAVKHFYATIDFAKELKDEYSVAHGRDNAARRVGVGFVVVQPTAHTRLYSIVTPLAAAIAAGNCLVLELSDTLLQVDLVLRTLLTQALDTNTFCIVKSTSDHPAIQESAVIIDQAGEVQSAPLVNQLRSSSTNRCVAIVDRSADIEAAAKAIATARFSFGGTSPYAPDLVLVNEFVKKEFFEACSQHASSLFAGEAGGKRKNSHNKLDGNREEELKKAIKSAEEKGQVSSFGSTEFKLVDILDKTTSIMTTKISGRYLPIATCSSLTDAIYNQEYNAPLLASYLFAEPESAKYLGQFLPSHISVINKIPTHLLVGPAAPTTHEPDFLYRYNRNMFSVARPQFVEKVQGGFQKVEDALLGSSKASKATASKLRQLALEPLPPTGQSENKGIGFFEQGLLVGAGIYASLLLPALGFTAYFLGRKGLELVARYKR